VLGSAAWTLTLVAMPPSIAARVALETPPQRRSDVPVKLAFPVEAIEPLRPQIGRLGGELEPAGRTWEFGGSRRCDCSDPEGNVIQLLERV
jgi:predicted enzyme related to lactoylglutathione lyase